MQCTRSVFDHHAVRSIHVSRMWMLVNTHTHTHTHKDMPLRHNNIKPPGVWGTWDWPPGVLHMSQYLFRQWLCVSFSKLWQPLMGFVNIFVYPTFFPWKVRISFSYWETGVVIMLQPGSSGVRISVGTCLFFDDCYPVVFLLSVNADWLTLNFVEFILRNVQTGCGAHTASYSMVTGVISRDKPAGAWNWRPTYI